MVKVRRVSVAALSAAPAGCLLVSATDARIRWRGRHVHDRAAGTVAFDWPCAGFSMSTAAARVLLRMDGGNNLFNLLIDGHQVAVLTTRSGVCDYELPALPEAPALTAHIVEVQKRTEPKIGSIWQTMFGGLTHTAVLHGVIIEGHDHAAPLEVLPAPPTRRLEFLGDSETSGMGILGPSQPGSPGLGSILTVSAAHQDALQAWPAVVARAFAADYRNIAWSGAGVVWNVPGGCTADAPLHDLYPRLLGNSATSPTIESDEAWAPDAVVLYSGGNDWYSLIADSLPQCNATALTDGFRRFLVRLRALRPTATIIVLLPSATSVGACIGSVEQQARFAADMATCWRDAAASLADPRLFLERVEPRTPCVLSDRADWGQMGHWSVQGNAKWADAVVPLVATRLGWEVAASATVDVAASG